MSNETRLIIDRIADVARRTAIQQSPIIEGTVLSRNPDGSLNVDDGRGGCARVAPKANVRVGQRIRLGIEPALGQQTFIDQLNIEIESVSKPCPHDPRDPELEQDPADEDPIYVYASNSMRYENQSDFWADRWATLVYYGQGTAGGPKDRSFYFGSIRWNESVTTAGADVVQWNKPHFLPDLPGFLDYGQHGIPYKARRGVWRFPTAGLDPSKAIISASVEFWVIAAASPFDRRVVVAEHLGFALPDYPGPYPTLPAGELIPGLNVIGEHALGVVRILDLLPVGQYHEIPLNLDGILAIRRFQDTHLVLMMEDDFYGTEPPLQGVDDPVDELQTYPANQTVGETQNFQAPRLKIFLGNQ